MRKVGKCMKTTDEVLLKHLQRQYGDDILNKATGSNAGLVQEERMVTRNGKSFPQKVWVNPNKDQKEDKKPAKLPDTSKKHKNADGLYTAERGELHKKIKDKVFDACGKPAAGERPQAILMGGGSASGKGRTLDTVVKAKLEADGVEVGIVDPDEVKKELPEYEGYQEEDINEAAAAVHTESSEVGAHIIDEIVGDGRHFVYDGTMKNTAKYEQLIDRLQDAGYDVHIYVTDVPLDVAIERSDARAEETGRKVPHSIIEGSHRGVPGSVEALKDKVNSYQVFDNSGDSLKLMAANGFVEPELYTAFLEKGGVNYRTTD